MTDSILTDSLRMHIGDLGPIYHEFKVDAFIKEPWNAYSSLVLLIPVFFWMWKLKGEYKKYMIITVLLPLLFLNGVGSTLYHAFRSSNIFLALDGFPAAIMNLILSGYLWYKLVNSRWKAAIIVLLFYCTGVGLMLTLRLWIADGAANVFYLIVGICIFLPLSIHLVKQQFYKWQLIVLTIVLLGASLIFRSLDFPTPNPFPQLMPQGTHFLWHIFSAMAVFSLGFYFWYSIKKESVKD